MKQIATWMMAGIMAGAFVSCKEKQPSPDIIITKPVEKVKPKTTQKMGDYEQTIEVAWVGAKYNVAVARKADTSLPIVDDGAGNKYYDNKISVRIIRQDGSEFFNRTFSKQDFLSYVDDIYKKNSALLGIVLDKAEGDYVWFAASVGSPDRNSDEYVPLVMKVSRFGDVSISKDVQLDTVGDEQPGSKDEQNVVEEEDDYDEDGV